MKDKQNLHGTRPALRGRRSKRVLAAVMGLGLSLIAAQAQLAITELMTCASTNTVALPGPDWWELTNFGTNAIDLSNYLFCDKDKVWPDGASGLPFIDVIIDTNESIIFVRTGSGMTTADEFRAWWGLGPTYPRIFFYPKLFGFDELGDGVQFGDPYSEYFEQRYVGEALNGHTFTYDTNCGGLTVYSQLGDGCSWQAATTDDVGSPGACLSKLPLRITQQPTNQVVEAGYPDVTLMSVRVCGLPTPGLYRYQWYRNGRPVSGAGTKDYCVPVATPQHAGDYFVEIWNGLERITSSLATVTVTLSNKAPYLLCRAVECPPPYADCPGLYLPPSKLSNNWERQLLCPPNDVTIFGNQSAPFYVVAAGWPIPTIQWSYNGVPLAYATNRALVVYNVQPANAGTYSVRLQNSIGSTQASASLSFKSKPLLKVTEAMQSPCPNCPNCKGPRKNWWELTNLDAEAVDLFGYRWDDGPGSIGGGPTITNHVVIGPGESIIFGEGMALDDFKFWWGTNNLPRNLQFIRYTANGLDEGGDSIWLWNPFAAFPEDYVHAVAFSTGSSPGASRWFAPFRGAEFGPFNQEGKLGAFRAAEDCSVGSPGRYPWAPRLTHWGLNANSVSLTWSTESNSIYSVLYGTNIATGPWLPIKTNLIADGQFMSATVTNRPGVSATNALAGFYRVICNPFYYVP